MHCVAWVKQLVRQAERDGEAEAAVVDAEAESDWARTANAQTATRTRAFAEGNIAARRMVRCLIGRVFEA